MEQANDGIHLILSKLRKNLDDYFLKKDLDDASLWRASPNTNDTRGDKRFLYDYHFPAPPKEIGERVLASPDYLLNKIRPLIWGYCAGHEYLRTGDQNLCSISVECLSEWASHIQINKIWKQENSSTSSKRQKSIDQSRFDELEKNKVPPKEMAKILKTSVGNIYKRRSVQKNKSK